MDLSLCIHHHHHMRTLWHPSFYTLYSLFPTLFWSDSFPSSYKSLFDYLFTTICHPSSAQSLATDGFKYINSSFHTLSSLWIQIPPTRNTCTSNSRISMVCILGELILLIKQIQRRMLQDVLRCFLPLLWCSNILLLQGVAFIIEEL